MLRKLKARVASLLGLMPPTPEALRKKGLTIGNNVVIHTREIDVGHGYLISVGDQVTVAPGATLLAHDASIKEALGYARVGRISIGSHVFIGAGAVILPGVSIGDYVIIGAGAVVSRSIPANSVAVGNPARVIGSYDDYIEKNRRLMETAPVYTTYWQNKTPEEKARMQQELSNGQIGFDL